MLEKYIKLLEFDVIIKRVAGLSRSEEASALIIEQMLRRDDDAYDDGYDDASYNETKIEQLNPKRTNRPSLAKGKAETACGGLKKYVYAIVRRIDSHDAQPQGSLPAISVLIKKLNAEGIVFEEAELFAIASFIDEGGRVLRWLSPDDTLAQTLLAGIPDCSVVSNEIFSILDKDGSLRDLPALREIKRQIAALERELKNITSFYFENENTRSMLQSAVPSIRDGRTVIALKANFRGRVRGIVHEVSASGQTVFLEPEGVIEKNNEITILKQKLAAEIRRILRELTGKVAVHKDILDEFNKKIIYIETIRARAVYSYNTHGVFALRGDTIKIIQAKHPLLGERAVPVDITLKNEVRAVIITGPNTGGKTVALKTIGLFVLMNQAALALPAEEGTSLPFFDAVYADIGDEQSIDAALSTFSAHIKNIASILCEAAHNSLVLLDELGAGTEAGEGAAIAMAVTDAFIEKGATIFVTTHHSVLKNYGWTQRYVENASMEFNAETLLPTYKLIMGIPGESRAIDIAGHNGLPEDIINVARKYKDEGLGDVSKLIEGLKEKYLLVENENTRLKTETGNLNGKIRENDLRELRLRQKEAEIKNGSIHDLRALLLESRKKLENLVREIKEGEITREKTLAVKEFFAGLGKAIENEDGQLQNEILAISNFEKTIHGDAIHDDKAREKINYEIEIGAAIREGALVLAGKERRRGIVKRAGKKNFWLVEIGSLSLNFAEHDLVPVREKKYPLKDTGHISRKGIE
jgi:DNA mismatch repair protein MutS2